MSKAAVVRIEPEVDTHGVRLEKVCRITRTGHCFFTLNVSSSESALMPGKATKGYV